MTANKYSFKLKSDVSELKNLCRHLSHFGQINGLSDTYISKINICLDELFTNIVLYGFKDDLEHTVGFRLDLTGNAIMIVIEDNGLPFNPLLVKDSELPSDISSAEIGGLGLQIVKKLMDNIWYERKHGRNRLTLKKAIHSTGHIYKGDKAGSITSNYYA